MIGTRFVGRLLVGVALVAVVGCSSSSTSSSPTSTTAGKPSGPVRGFDGTTIRVASLGIKGQLPSVEFGARGRIKRFDDTSELKGVKIEYVLGGVQCIITDKCTTVPAAQKVCQGDVNPSTLTAFTCGCR